jgi:hypothetical protein
VRYALLIYSDEHRWASWAAEDLARAATAHAAYADELRTGGKLVLGEPLQPTRAARSLRFEGAERVVTDGPFAETKEQLGGFYLIEAESLDEATSWARRMPVEPGVTVEVRPVAAMPVEAAR